MALENPVPRWCGIFFYPMNLSPTESTPLHAVFYCDNIAKKMRYAKKMRVFLQQKNKCNYRFLFGNVVDFFILVQYVT